MIVNKVKMQLIIYLSIGTVALADLQDSRVTGFVRDVNSYREISNVNIFIKGTSLGTTSDVGGEFILIVPRSEEKGVVIFRHIGYDLLEIPLDSLSLLRYVYLQPRVIPLRGVTMEEERIDIPEIERDIPQTISMVKAKNFEIRGYVDAGDLLKTDHSVQVNEELSGKKTVSLRGGNPDEIVVLYNGIRMNSNYDNVFDMSLIDLEDVERFEIIKGSNTALYGPEAFSGVINIVPKLQHDYHIRLHQRVGTYQSGNWGFNLYQSLNRLNGSYSFKQGGSKRQFVDVEEGGSGLENKSLHHTANLSYHFSENPAGQPVNSLGLMSVYSSLNYDNQRDVESLSNVNSLISLRYTGDIGRFTDLNLSLSLSRLKEDQFLASGTGALERHIKDQTLHFNAEKGLKLGLTDFLFAYQFKHAELDYSDQRQNFREVNVGLESALFQRQHHGGVVIGKLRGEIESHFLNIIEISGSFRYDWLRDEQTDSILRGESEEDEREGGVGHFQTNEWQERLFKFGLSLSGNREDLTFDGYISFGSNTKFPTLFQQISSPILFTEGTATTNLEPERNNSLELNFVIAKDLREEKTIYGWEVSGTFFKNQYDNKLRVSSTPGIPVMFYDNVPDARISGLETKSSVFFFRKKVTVEFGLSKYYISEKAAFPFKSDYKHTWNVILNHAGYSLQIHWFKEGEQAGWLRQQSGRFVEIILPEFTNIDLHLSKTFQLGRIKLFANISGRNLLNDEEVILQGLAIRDRRYYVTVGTQY